MDAEVGFGRVEDQPAAAHVASAEAELVSQEGAELVSLGRVEHGVKTADHDEIPSCGEGWFTSDLERRDEGS